VARCQLPLYQRVKFEPLCAHQANQRLTRSIDILRQISVPLADPASLLSPRERRSSNCRPVLLKRHKQTSRRFIRSPRRHAGARLAGEPPHVMLAPRLRDIGLMEFNRDMGAIAEGLYCVEQALPILRHYL
jgi:hypothetical protein